MGKFIPEMCIVFRGECIFFRRVMVLMYAAVTPIVISMDWLNQHRDHFEGLRVLVSGAAGFIGSHLTEALTGLGAHVVAYDNLAGGNWANIAHLDQSKITPIEADIRDAEAVESACQGCRYVFHHAALASVPQSVEEPVEFHSVNVMGTVVLLDGARKAGVERVMYAGSSSAYGDPPDDDPRKEADAFLPASPYAASKLAGEHALHAFAQSYDLDTAVVRYFNIFGPRQDPKSAYAAVIAAFAQQLHRGKVARIYGDGEQTRDFTYVANSVHANLLAASHPERVGGRSFNIATGRRISVNLLYERMAEMFGRSDLRPEYLPDRAGDVKHSLADISLARQVLGFEPQVDFETGIEATVAWYRENLTA